MACGRWDQTGLLLGRSSGARETLGGACAPLTGLLVALAEGALIAWAGAGAARVGSARLGLHRLDVLHHDLFGLAQLLGRAEHQNPEQWDSCGNGAQNPACLQGKW